MCSGCGQCGGAKRTRVSEASDLEPEAALIQLAGLESGRQAWTANGSEQPCEVTVSARNGSGQLVHLGR